ncbi:thermonuclease [Caudoviricetes sp.]|nr:thermonuclease [Caudoviricetes sp.]
MVPDKYAYSAKIIDVYDGDTLTAEIDLGFNVKFITKLRLLNIDAPEVRGFESLLGLRSRDYVRHRVLNKIVTIKTVKDSKDKYGRYLADIWYNEGADPYIYINLNDELVDRGLAELKIY